MGYDSLNDLKNKKGIYIISDKNSQNRVYVGETIDFEKRIISHFKLEAPITSNLLYMDLSTYDWSKINIEFINFEGLNKTELKEREIEFIERFESLYPKGYNLYNGPSKNVKWKKISKNNYQVLGEFLSEGKNLFLENSKLKKEILLPEFIYERLLENNFSIYSLDYFINYYSNNNILKMSSEILPFQGHRLISILNDFNKDKKSIALRMEKVLYNDQIYLVEGNVKHSYVKLRDDFKFKDQVSLNLEKLALKILANLRQAKNNRIVQELYIKCFFEYIKDLYGSKVDIRRLAFWQYTYRKNEKIIVVKYPRIGYFSKLIQKEFKALFGKFIDRKMSVVILDQNALLIKYTSSKEHSIIGDDIHRLIEKLSVSEKYNEYYEEAKFLLQRS